ncbi:hypothetical protein Ae201684_004635 [Aphanomyces euteiches]|uniref:Uncharacterized protein n=1 Tax=Aphanomyces euteiches TaxID=100861 RepID=A0A6G0XHJ8_9STRA|nr:hypothetical protein Ae201684_004635 [Aphanomyces euteiches]KAH9139370.1 hypothetical protein AeRB84_016393 [Aphanomyces euteiches]
MGDLEAKIAALEKDAATAASMHAEAIAKLNEEKQELTNQLHAARIALEVAHTDVNDLRTQVSTLVGVIARTEAAFAANETKMISLQVERDELQAQNEQVRQAREAAAAQKALNKRFALPEKEVLEMLRREPYSSRDRVVRIQIFDASTWWNWTLRQLRGDALLSSSSDLATTSCSRLNKVHDMTFRRSQIYTRALDMIVFNGDFHVGSRKVMLIDLEGSPGDSRQGIHYIRLDMPQEYRDQGRSSMMEFKIQMVPALP